MPVIYILAKMYFFHLLGVFAYKILTNCELKVSFQVNPIRRLLHNRMGTLSAMRLGVSESSYL